VLPVTEYLPQQATFSIRVQFPPMFWIPSQREAVYIGQDSVTVECHSEAYPQSINYWVNNKGAMIQSNNKHEIVTVDTGYKVYMKLHIKNIQKSDITEYRCVAKNSLGHSDGSISLYEVDPPTPPTTTTSTTSSTFIMPLEETTQDWRRKKGHHRKRLRESRRHSYTLDKDFRDRNVEHEQEEENKKVRIIHREEANLEEDTDATEEKNMVGTNDNQSSGKSFWSSNSVKISSNVLSFLVIIALSFIVHDRK